MIRSFAYLTVTRNSSAEAEAVLRTPEVYQATPIIGETIATADYVTRAPNAYLAIGSEVIQDEDFATANLVSRIPNVFFAAGVPTYRVNANLVSRIPSIYLSTRSIGPMSASANLSSHPSILWLPVAYGGTLGNYLNATTRPGIDNSGAADCTSAILAAITYYKANGYDGLYFPDGTYRLGGALNVPPGTTLVGQGMTTAWLKGKLAWTSNSTFTDLKIGDNLTGTVNITGAISSYTTFTRCRFRGGGGSYSTSERNNAVIHIGNSTASAHHITHSYCDIECNLGVETVGDSKFRKQFNNVYLFEYGTNELTGAHLSYITFDHCNFGVHNGVRSGAPRFNVECYCSPFQSGDLENLVYHGWDHLEFTNSVFEIPDACALDLPSARLVSDPHTHACQYALVQGNTFKGGGAKGGVAGGYGWGYNIAMEGARDVTIDDNDFGRAADTGVSTGGAGFGGLYPYWVPSRNTVVTNNRFNYNVANGITVGSSPKLRLMGNSLAAGNVFHVNSGGGSAINIGHDVLNRECDGVHVHNNTVNEYRTSSIPSAVRMENTSNVVVGGDPGGENTFRNHNSTSAPVITLVTGTVNLNYDITPNFFYHA